MTSTHALVSPAHAAAALPPIVGLSGTVSSDRRFTLMWTPNPAYAEYEIHESTADPVTTLKAVVPAPPRVSGQLKVRDTALRYGVRGRTADGELGPFGAAVEVLVRVSGGTVSVTTSPFAPPLDGGGDASAPGDLIPKNWKLTTTLNDGGKPLEIFRDGRTTTAGKSADLDTFVDSGHWRLTNEQGRQGIKITCPSDGVTTANSHNMRWELRQMDAAGAKEVNFDLVDGGPTLDTEVAVLDLQGNAGVLAQIHGKWTGPSSASKEERKKAGDDDLTVWRAEPNGSSDSYSLWITKQNDAHGGTRVDAAVKYGQAIRIGYRIAKRRVRFVYNGVQLPFEMPITDSMHIDFGNIKFYFKAGLYLQIKKQNSAGTVILYSAEIN
jgi:hypothetical protein